jgi:hypothetical protein
MYTAASCRASSLGMLLSSSTARVRSFAIVAFVAP